MINTVYKNKILGFVDLAEIELQFGDKDFGERVLERIYSLYDERDGNGVTCSLSKDIASSFR